MAIIIQLCMVIGTEERNPGPSRDGLESKT